MVGKLRLEDLRVGMQVKVSDLLSIYGIYMLVSNISNVNSDDTPVDDIC